MWKNDYTRVFSDITAYPHRQKIFCLWNVHEEFHTKICFGETIKVHTGSRPFTCKICYRSSIRRPYLVKHKLIHIVDCFKCVRRNLPYMNISWTTVTPIWRESLLIGNFVTYALRNRATSSSMTQIIRIIIWMWEVSFDMQILQNIITWTGESNWILVFSSEFIILIFQICSIVPVRTNKLTSYCYNFVIEESFLFRSLKVLGT